MRVRLHSATLLLCCTQVRFTCAVQVSQVSWLLWCVRGCEWRQDGCSLSSVELLTVRRAEFSSACKWSGATVDSRCTMQHRRHLAAATLPSATSAAHVTSCPCVGLLQIGIEKHEALQRHRASSTTHANLIVWLGGTDQASQQGDRGNHPVHTVTA